MGRESESRTPSPNYAYSLRENFPEKGGEMNPIRIVAVGLALMLFPAAARAACATDQDCYTGLICAAGRCHLPAEAGSHAAGGSADTGWARGGGVVGFIGAAAVLSLALASEGMRARAASDTYNPHHEWTSDWTASVSLGGTSVVVNVIMAPIAFAGGRATRQHTGVRGLMGLRIGGWVLYGVSIVVGASIIPLAPAGMRPPPALIASSGILGATGLVLFGADGIKTYHQALARSGGSALEVGPVVAPIMAPDGSARGGLLGIAGRF